MEGQLHRIDVTVLPAGFNRIESEIAGNWSPALSPDGRHMAYVSDRGGSPAVWVQPVGSELTFRVDTGPEPVSTVRWSSGGGWLACQLAPGGAPRQEIWLVRPDGSDLHQIAGFGTDTADNMRWLPGRPVLALTENLTSAVLINVTTGERTVVAEGPLLSLLDVDPAGRFALLRYGPRGARSIVLRDLSASAASASSISAGFSSAAEKPVTRGERAVFSPGGGCIYALSQDGEFPVLLRITGDAVEVLAHDGEVEDFTITADGRTAAVLWNVRGGESEVALIDLDHDGDRAPNPVIPLPGPVVGDLTWSFDGSALGFTAEGPGRPHGVWVYESGQIRAVSAEPEAPGAIRPRLLSFPAHDGLTLTGWLFTPATDGPHPTVVWLHGGPEAQERPGHGPLFQSLVDRGIAVFAANVRGSSGFGRAFVDADNVALRYGAIEDVRTCADHLRSTGIAGRIGVMGRSYGGYLTLAALTWHPDLFDVGVDICGMSNFATFYDHTEPWIAAAAVSKYGHPTHDAALLHDLSPINRIDRLRAPLLVVHGENDSNVPVIEATQVVEALAARDHPHRYLLFPGEGHELLHRTARATFLRETLTWLENHLTRQPH
ncbi:S9 family peptidase [Actinoplanes derwentensis]|uniref:Dipeptidyl aminopeptidase/acylaminoacyl peptidase n=1 Tax=Actinoplanes derwentensis TaxID=113562 RepID=A0A1H2D7T8_9ACTN|nr:prolyl oligopeptidase family serine peptidase [Actinoplanes derwentensis]GID86300.1 peptidase S9 [Actinoplanes derwentensis]SDT78659.1 Dipeptidyl aminopeptidase/acylaminoacyl peptidase [Actinoplanes derwentensis]